LYADENEVYEEKINEGEHIMKIFFEFDIDEFSRIDYIDYSEESSEGKQQSLKHVRIYDYASEQEMVQAMKSILKVNFHHESFLQINMITKRIIFNNLFKPNNDPSSSEPGFSLCTEKVYEYRSMVFISKILMIYFTKLRDIGFHLETMKSFYCYEGFSKEIKTIFKNLDSFFKVDQNLLESKTHEAF
jgi:hypothetical protein